MGRPARRAVAIGAGRPVSRRGGDSGRRLAVMIGSVMADVMDDAGVEGVERDGILAGAEGLPAMRQPEPNKHDASRSRCGYMSPVHRAEGTTISCSRTRGPARRWFFGHADSKTTQIYAHYAPSEHEVKMVNEAFTEPAAQPTSVT